MAILPSYSDIRPSTVAQPPSFMADLGHHLIERGWPILPIVPRQKFPGQYQRGEWRGYREWQRHCTRQTSKFELDVWSRWPGCGIGIACGTVVGLDIDITDLDLVTAIEAKARAELGDTPLLRIGQLPKRLLVYRASQPFAPVKRMPLECLAAGNQFVAYGIHPATDRPYEWPIEAPHEVDLCKIPVVTEAQIRAFVEREILSVPAELRHSRLGPDRAREVYWTHDNNPRGTIPAITEAIGHIPNDDLQYDDWIKIGMAIKAAIGEAGLPVWVAWSQRSPKSGTSGKSDTPARVWRGLKPRGEIGAGTIYSYALQNGWIPDSSLIMNGTVEDAVAAVPVGSIHLGNGTGNGKSIDESPVDRDWLDLEPFSTVKPTKESTPEARPQPATDVDPTAAIVAGAPGLLGDMVRWMTATTESPQPWLSLGAALCGVGTAMGRRWKLEAPDTRSNVYVIALADSGGGKDHPRKLIRRLLISAGLGQYLGGETIASGAALMASVAQHPVRLFQVDEFGHFVAAVLDQKSHAHHRREIMTQLTTLWSSASEVVMGTEYANQRERPRMDIVNPCVSVYGSTVPMTFWKAMQSGNISDGSLARFLMFLSPASFPDENPIVEIDTAPLVEAIKGIAAEPERAGNLAMISTAVPTVRTVPFSPAASDADIDLRAMHLEMKRQHEGTQLSALYARYREHVRRVALIAAVAANPSSPIVTVDVYRWADSVVAHCISTMREEGEKYIADSQFEADCNRIRDIIAKAGGSLAQTDLLRKSKMSARALGEIVSTMAQSGVVGIKIVPTKTKPVTIVSLV